MKIKQFKSFPHFPHFLTLLVLCGLQVYRSPRSGINAQNLNGNACATSKSFIGRTEKKVLNRERERERQKVWCNHGT